MKKALELSMLEARNMGVNYVDTEHMLLGILGDDNSLVSQYFFTMGVDIAAARRQITTILQDEESNRSARRWRPGPGRARGSAGAPAPPRRPVRGLKARRT